MPLAHLGRSTRLDLALLSELRLSAEDMLRSVPEAQQPDMLDQIYRFKYEQRRRREHDKGDAHAT